VDEAGRGCLSGPVSVGFVHFSLQTIQDIHSGKILFGLNDSKKLSPLDREYFYQKIIEHSIFWRVLFVSNRLIDQININQSIFRAIQKVHSFHPEQLFLIDGNYKPRIEQLKYRSIVKGDSKYSSIASASILAKVSRDRYMTKKAFQYKNYGWERNFGYGTKMHRDAIIKYGITPLHRKTFLDDTIYIQNI
jgi:ribonuclease HII